MLSVQLAKIIFMGTPDFAVPTFEKLLIHHDVVAAVTQPDRPAGRGGQVRYSPVKVAAVKAGIPVLQPEKIRKQTAIDELRQYEADLYVVAAFGQILPQELLDIPLYGSINVHASLLPRWRGAAPIHAAIRSGDAETGVTIMKMDAGLDTGPMLRARSVAIDEAETAQTLHDKLAVLGADLLIETLDDYLSGVIEPQAQPEDGITYAPQITKDEGRINWEDSAGNIEHLVRAFTPWPGTFTYWDGKLLKIHSGKAAAGELEPGQVGEIDDEIVVGTGEGVFVLSEVQLEGKKVNSVVDFVRGRPAFIGSQLG